MVEFLNKDFYVIGLMSGTSVDGLDIAYCRFFQDEVKWNYQILYSTTIPYESEWKNRLYEAENLSALDYLRLDVELGIVWGNWINDFIKEKHIKKIDFIASHGHTIFHRPSEGFTSQIGNAAQIKALTSLPVISDFRSLDVALNGNGAPLVPIGDQLLFGQYGACINIGGFANISYNDNGIRKAYDITPVNIILNHYAQKLAIDFDEDGQKAKTGQLYEDLFQELISIEYYNYDGPKSLGKEQVVDMFYPIIEKYNISIESKLRTCTELLAFQICRSIKISKASQVLFTGGGAKNKFLMQKISENCKAELIIPEKTLIDYKEALIFAFLGLLRLLGEINCLKSVTGAVRNCSSGCIL